MVDKVARGQVFLQVLRFSCAGIIPPMLHTHVHLLLLLPGQTGEAWETAKSSVLPVVLLRLSRLHWANSATVGTVRL